MLDLRMRGNVYEFGRQYQRALRIWTFDGFQHEFTLVSRQSRFRQNTAYIHLHQTWLHHWFWTEVVPRSSRFHLPLSSPKTIRARNGLRMPAPSS